MRREVYWLQNQQRERLYFRPPVAAVQIEGWGMPPVEHWSIHAPLQHGATWKGFRLAPRTVTVQLHLSAANRDELFQLRSELGRFLSPRSGALEFHVGLPDGSHYYLQDVVFDTGLELETRGLEPRKLGTALRLLAYDPVWLSAEENIYIGGPGYSSELQLTFPLNDGGPEAENDFDTLQFGSGGAGVVSMGFLIQYGGTWPSYPTIQYYGPMEDPSLTNETSGESLSLNYALAAGEMVTFDLRFGYKTVTNQDGEDLLPYVTVDSDLVNFHLEPSPSAPGGWNEFTFRAKNTSGDTYIALRWRNRFLAI